ncbi:YdeI/OmpD-associated family protein [Reinekea forsetii]|nr:YdeI/OmpD-associated family protein [Reinekea forsetii]
MIDRSLIGKQFEFNAILENWAEGMDYCAVSVPSSVTKSLGTKGPVLVRASVNNSEPFQVSLFPVGGGKHYIRIKSKIRKLTNTKMGDNIKLDFVVIDPEDVDIPDDLLASLEKSGMIDGFVDLPPGKRNFLIRRIGEAAKPATREKRIQEALEAAIERNSKK